MSESRAHLIKELFQQASDLPPQDRERFLTEHCAGDGAMKEEIEKLLGWDSAVTPRFLQGSPAPQVERTIPKQIGHFEIIRLIGEGGMGSVFEARQDHPRRTVALKIIRMAMASESVRRRFEYEVQILGQLKHPGIAQIYEAGTHDDGGGPVPYFAMEFIRGPSLLAFARDQKLSTSQRLSLAGEICDAVHHAHQKGVVHRDLKPANILVESDGGVTQPKILDFGVARATHSDLQQVTMHTEVGQIVGTLSYMSPEQVSGRADELDVRSDVYALGVIVFELLAERLPYDLRGRSIPEAGSIIRDQEPSRLSSVHSAFRGDIETIVAKALEKEKERRYQSAAELAEDIRRYLRDEPIIARPASRGYQIRKFAKRNRAIVGAVVAVFVTLVVGIIATSISMVRAREAQALAVQRSEESRRSAAKATAVSQFLQEMLSSVDPGKGLGQDITIRQALDEAAARIDSGLLAKEPELEGELRATIGTTYMAIGHYPEAEPQLRKALEIRRRLTGDVRQELMENLNNLGLLLDSQGRLVEAESMYREVLAIARPWHGDKNVDVASAMQSLGAALRKQRKFDEADRYYRQSLEIRRELLGPGHLDVAQTLNSMALLAQDRGDYDKAEQLFREALDIRRKNLGNVHPVVAGSINNLANLLAVKGNRKEAETLLREALEMRRQLLGNEHPDVAQGMNNVANHIMRDGQFEEAEQLFRGALEIWRKTLPPNHPDIGHATTGLGRVLNAQGKSAEAEPYLRESLADAERDYPEGHWARPWMMSLLGDALARQHKFTEAEPMLLSAYQGLASNPEAQQKYKDLARQHIVNMYVAWEKPELADQWRSESEKK